MKIQVNKLYQSGDAVVKIVSTNGKIFSEEFPVTAIDMNFKRTKENYKEPCLYQYDKEGKSNLVDRLINYDLVEL